MPVSTLYFQRGAYPFIEKTTTNGQGQVVGVSNPSEPGDVQITEAQYNAQLAAYNQTIQDDIDAARAIVESNKAIIAANRASASTKLLALGFTQDEIDAIFQ